MYKVIVSDDHNDRGPTHFEKLDSQFWHAFTVAGTINVLYCIHVLYCNCYDVFNFQVLIMFCAIIINHSAKSLFLL